MTKSAETPTDAAATPSLQVTGLGRSFRSPDGGTVVALRDVNLAVSSGEFVSIVGASGSGKSTLLRIVDGLIPPTSGRIEVDHDASKVSVDELVKVVGKAGYKSTPSAF